jgi:general nucleoside transport system permease protein
MRKETLNHKNHKDLLTFWKSIRLPVLAFLAAFIAGAILIIITDLSIYATFSEIFARLNAPRIVALVFGLASIPSTAWIIKSQLLKHLLQRKDVNPFFALFIHVAAILVSIATALGLLIAAGFGPLLAAAVNIGYSAYYALFEGSIGNLQRIAAAFNSGDITRITEAINPFSESLVAATPYIFGALSVAVALRCGIFNIGTEGQIYIGALASTIVGVYLVGLPAWLHITLSMGAGALAGAFWAGIPAILKTRFDSNEVINTIMLNYIAFKFVEWMLIGPIRRPNAPEPFSSYIQPTAVLPRFLPYPNRFHIGFFIAITVAIFMFWLLFKTPTGLEIRLVGRNPNASKYAGINIKNKYILAFLISGAMAGLAGANEVLGVNHYLSGTISPGYGWDSISLSILGNNHPIGVIFTSLMFGFLRNGSTRMQNLARVPIEIITIMQALIIGFIAAPTIIQKLFKLKQEKSERMVVTRGWGK